MFGSTFSRRRFLQAAMLSSFSSGVMLPSLSSASTAQLQNRILMNLRLSGGPDFRHLIVPAYDPAPDSYGNKYWLNRYRSHSISSSVSDIQSRWEEDFFPSL